jgi:hypothetical protein
MPLKDRLIFVAWVIAFVAFFTAGWIWGMQHFFNIDITQ